MRVVKIGGRAQADPCIGAALCQAWNDSPNGLCIVHGGGDEISAMQRALGKEASFVGGRRVTSRGDLELLRMVLSGAVNKRLVNSLVAAGGPAAGLLGGDDGFIGAEVFDPGFFGFVGRPDGI